MTIKEAREQLAGPLIFGNEQQIRAVEFLAKAEEIRQLLEKGPCDECDGSGDIECQQCSGTGRVECDACDGTGVSEGRLPDGVAKPPGNVLLAARELADE